MERGREESRKFNIKSNAHFSSYLYTRARTVLSRISFTPLRFVKSREKKTLGENFSCGKSQKLDARERTASDVTRSRTSEASERGTERARQRERERERDYRSRRLEETRHKAPPCLPDAKPMLLFPCPPSRTSTTIRITLLCAWRIPTPAFNANPTRIGR